MARDVDLDLGSSHTTYRRASLIDLYTCQISLKSKKLFVDGRTYVCTYARTDRRIFDTGFIRSAGKSSLLKHSLGPRDIWPKNELHNAIEASIQVYMQAYNILF